MGAWGTAAWENDGAADWFGDLFEATKFASHVEKMLKKKDIEENHEEIRAAAYIVVALGQTFIWPVARALRRLRVAVKLSRNRGIQLFRLVEYSHAHVNGEETECPFFRAKNPMARLHRLDIDRPYGSSSSPKEFKLDITSTR